MGAPWCQALAIGTRAQRAIRPAGNIASASELLRHSRAHAGRQAGTATAAGGSRARTLAIPGVLLALRGEQRLEQSDGKHKTEEHECHVGRL